MFQSKASVYSSDIWWEKLDKFVKEGVCEKIGVAELDQSMGF